MTNEKILLVKSESFLPAHEAKTWEANGWEVKYELSPFVRGGDEIMLPLDFTDSISHADMDQFLKEIDNG